MFIKERARNNGLREFEDLLGVEKGIEDLSDIG